MDNLKILIQEKIKSFMEFVKTIAPPEKQHEIDNFKIDYVKTMLFLMSINEQKLEHHIDEFMTKFNISDEH